MESSATSLEKAQPAQPSDAQPTPHKSQSFLHRIFATKLRKVLIGGALLLIILALGLGLGLGLGLRKSTIDGGDDDGDASSTSPASSAPANANSTASSSRNYANATLASASIPGAVAMNLTVGSTWEYPLGYNVTTQTADPAIHFYTVDLFNTPESEIRGLISAGHAVACYFSAGSREVYRADAPQFPSAAVGKPLDGWPGEAWLDTRDTTIRSIMLDRISNAKNKGCQGVDGDNIDGYENETGFDLTANDAVDYIAFLSNAAHSLGLAYGLKNGGDIVNRTVSMAQWNVQEQCAKYNECGLYRDFIDANKPVFHVEYTDKDDATTVDAETIKADCDAPDTAGFSTIIKHLNLDRFVQKCQA